MTNQLLAELEMLQQTKDKLQNDYQNAVDKINELQQENKQLNSILTELEEWLEMMEEKETIGTYSMVQDKIQELKEKYK